MTEDEKAQALLQLVRDLWGARRFVLVTEGEKGQRGLVVNTVGNTDDALELLAYGALVIRKQRLHH